MSDTCPIISAIGKVQSNKFFVQQALLNRKSVKLSQIKEIDFFLLFFVYKSVSQFDFLILASLNAHSMLNQCLLNARSMLDQGSFEDPHCSNASESKEHLFSWEDAKSPARFRIRKRFLIT